VNFVLLLLHELPVRNTMTVDFRGDLASTGVC